MNMPANTDASTDKHKFYSVLVVSVFRMRKTDATSLIPDHATILTLLDSGLSHTEVAERLDMCPAVIGRQVARVRGKVLAGTYAPPLLPLEMAASVQSHR